MEKFNFKKELPFIIIALLPFVYLAFIWNNLPKQIPMHWNASGEIDRFGNKKELIFMLLMLNGIGYFLFLILPAIDPKGNLQKMGNKFTQIRYYLALFMTVLSLYILYSVQQMESKPTFVFVLIGLLFAVLGNYFKTVKPNYFVGIRTPWTLENETVWKKTHQLAGKLWFIGGILIIIITLIVKKSLIIYIFMTITAVISIIPVVYSYLEFKKLKK